MMDKKTRKKVVRYGILSGNILLLATIGIFVLYNRSASHTIRSNTLGNAALSAHSAANPMDQVSSAQIALQAAQMTKLAELTAVKNQADTERALLSIVPNDTTTLSKPQVVSTAQRSKNDIINYVVQTGDTVDSLSAKFRITTGSITGSNGLSGTALKPGATILIPPGNGIIYKVGASDSVSSIVNKYGADRDLLIAVNDAENGLKPGENIWIPNVAQPGRAVSYVRSFGATSYTPTYGYNGYDYGYCTWYVASRIAVPSNWGNANTWDDYARNTPGWAVSLTPVTGSIGQTDAGWAGHVAVVAEVSSDGSVMKYSDMNGLAGWGRVGTTTDWVPASRFQHYIMKQ